jgi:Na+/H+-dicarboxylate symporter
MTTSQTTARPSKPLYANFGFQVLVALVIGVILGLIARSIGPVDGGPNWLAQTLSTVGSAFVTLLRTLVPVLIFTAIVSSIANLRELNNAARLVWQTLLWFAITALIAVSIGIALGLIFQPGLNTAVTSEAARLPSRTGSWLDFLTGLIPVNIFGLQASTSINSSGAANTNLNFNVLQLLILSIAIGVAALKVGDAAQPFLDFTRSFLKVVHKLLWWVIRLVPIGTVGLLGNAIYSYGWDTLAQLGVYAGAIYVGVAIVLFIVYPSLLSAHGLNPIRYFQGAWPAIQFAFVSRSSIGTLPITERVTEKNLGVPREYAAFAVPLGATTKMDGCASIYPAISAIFVAQFFGIDLGIQDYLLIVFVSVIGSAATAGLTGATVMLTLTLSTLGLPLEGVGLLLAIDPILDMGRTAVNVAGQALVPTIVAKRQGILDQTAYDNVESIDALDTSPAPAE